MTGDTNQTFCWHERSCAPQHCRVLLSSPLSKHRLQQAIAVAGTSFPIASAVRIAGDDAQTRSFSTSIDKIDKVRAAIISPTHTASCSIFRRVDVQSAGGDGLCRTLVCIRAFRYGCGIRADRAWCSI